MTKRFAKPLRLTTVFSPQPLYFVTFCTMSRLKILTTRQVHGAFYDYARVAASHGIAVGRYVIMPDHIHLFVRVSGEVSLGTWVRGVKRAIGKVVKSGSDPIWQPGFFDHVLRGNESYAEKWSYVRDNPVRKGLATKCDDWPYAGEITVIDRV